jgi:2-methylisocitrate lyase-like PEP mutase family enzyme
MSQADRAHRFRALHIPGRPVVLCNIWDAGSAATVAAAGARAIATSSWSMAAALGYADGEAMPFDLLVEIVARIARTTDLPLTVDLEGGYAHAPSDVAANVARILETGAIGINFEDQLINGEGLHAIDAQAARIRAIRTMADTAGIPLFINARTDLFLKQPSGHAGLIGDALVRQAAYHDAGADGFFVPGLEDAGLIADLCQRGRGPINVMMGGRLTSAEAVAALGVARASYGPTPYIEAQQTLTMRMKDGMPSEPRPQASTALDRNGQEPVPLRSGN